MVKSGILNSLPYVSSIFDGLTSDSEPMEDSEVDEGD